MVATLGRWEIRTNPSKTPGYESIRVDAFVAESDPAELEQMAGDFITRHVLERDSSFFEG